MRKCRANVTDFIPVSGHRAVAKFAVCSQDVKIGAAGGGVQAHSVLTPRGRGIGGLTTAPAVQGELTSVGPSAQRASDSPVCSQNSPFHR